jgi:hypothetical protein
MTLDRPETEIRRSCAQTCRDSEREAQIRALLRSELDWSYLLRMAHAHGMMPLGETYAPLGVFEAFPFHLRMTERWQDRVRHCIRSATTTTVSDWALLSLPKCLFPLYYVVRPVRLTGKHGRRLLWCLL